MAILIRSTNECIWHIRDGDGQPLCRHFIDSNRRLTVKSTEVSPKEIRCTNCPQIAWGRMALTIDWQPLYVRATSPTAPYHIRWEGERLLCGRSVTRDPVVQDRPDRNICADCEHRLLAVKIFLAGFTPRTYWIAEPRSDVWCQEYDTPGWSACGKRIHLTDAQRALTLPEGGRKCYRCLRLMGKRQAYLKGKMRSAVRIPGKVYSKRL